MIALSRHRPGLGRPADGNGCWTRWPAFRAGTHVSGRSRSDGTARPRRRRAHAHADGTVHVALSDHPDPSRAPPRRRPGHLGRRPAPAAAGADRPPTARGSRWWPRPRCCSAATRSSSTSRSARDASLELFDVAGTVAYHGRGRPASWRISHHRGRTAPAWATPVQPFVVADGADVVRTLDLDLDPSARVRLRETLVLGRSGAGRRPAAEPDGDPVGGRPVLREDQLLIRPASAAVRDARRPSGDRHRRVAGPERGG